MITNYHKSLAVIGTLVFRLLDVTEREVVLFSNREIIEEGKQWPRTLSETGNSDKHRSFPAGQT